MTPRTCVVCQRSIGRVMIERHGRKYHAGCFTAERRDAWKKGREIAEIITPPRNVPQADGADRED